MTPEQPEEKSFWLERVTPGKTLDITPESTAKEFETSYMRGGCYLCPERPMWQDENGSVVVAKIIQHAEEKHEPGIARRWLNWY